MRQKFDFIDTDSVYHTVEFEVIHTDADYRSYGICACITGGGTQETVEVRERFITLGEAEATVRMLCECQVMPCTLKAVLE